MAVMVLYCGEYESETTSTDSNDGNEFSVILLTLFVVFVNILCCFWFEGIHWFVFCSFVRMDIHLFLCSLNLHLICYVFVNDPFLP